MVEVKRADDAPHRNYTLRLLFANELLRVVIITGRMTDNVHYSHAALS